MRDAPLLLRTQAQARAALLHDVRYDVELDLTIGPERFGSRTVVAFGCRQPGADTFIDLVAPVLGAVTLNGQPVDGRIEPGTGRLLLSGLAATNELVVEAECAYSRIGVGLHRFTDPVDDEVFCYTQFEPYDAHRVYACFDQPDLKAPFRLAVHAPAGFEVVSNGAVQSRPQEDEAGIWRFAETPPISPYITAVVAGPYHRVADRHGDIDLGLYCRQSMAEHLDPDEIFTLTKQGLDHFAREYDYPYPFGKYDQLFVPEFNFGAMENPGCVTFSEHYVFRSRVTDAARLQRGNTILHEMAHMWFGDLVTMRWWDDLWLNESFATYMAHDALDRATRFGAQSWANFAHSTKAWAYRQDQLPTTHPIVADVPDTDTVMTNFDGITYAKGASVLKQLVAWVGRGPFRDGLRDYFRRHEWDNAELRDFLAALEQPSGRALAPWSAQWLETSGVATLRPDLTVGEDGRYTAAALLQEAPEAQPTLRAHRITVGLYDEQDGVLARRERLELDVTGARTEVPGLVGQRVPALLLVNDDDLTYAKVRLDERSISALERGLSALDAPVARVISWSALWDMTRDAELATRRWVDLVAGHACTEPDIGVLQTLLSQAGVAIERYSDPANAPALRALMAAVARTQLQAVEPGSDRQLVWVRTLVASRQDLDFGRRLLAGEEDIPGLAVDVDLRWFVLRHLSAAGAADQAAIAAEQERDPTDIGVRGAAAARAALPRADTKKAAWTGAVEEQDLALATRRAMLRSFWQAGQDELLADYAHQRWTAALPAVWEERSIEEALDLTEGMYPHTVVSERVVAAADAALALDLPDPARRSISESRDDTLRALRARAFDAAHA